MTCNAIDLTRCFVYQGKTFKLKLVARRLAGNSIVKLVMKSRRLLAKLAKFMVSATKNSLPGEILSSFFFFFSSRMFTRTGEEVISLLFGFVVDVVDIESFIFAKN